jgi:hypothetical protein
MTYTLTNGNEVRLDYEATTDKDDARQPDQPQLLQPRLQGRRPRQVLQIKAKRGTRRRPGLIPTGVIAEVAGGPLDFTQPSRSARHRESSRRQHPRLRPQLRDRRGRRGVVLAARAYDPVSGRALEVLHGPAGRAALHGQRPERLDRGEVRPGVSGARGLLPGDAALSRFGEPARLPVDPPAPGRGVPEHDDLPVLGQVGPQDPDSQRPHPRGARRGRPRPSGSRRGSREDEPLLVGDLPPVARAGHPRWGSRSDSDVGLTA